MRRFACPRMSRGGRRRAPLSEGSGPRRRRSSRRSGWSRRGSPTSFPGAAFADPDECGNVLSPVYYVGFYSADAWRKEEGKIRMLRLLVSYGR